MDHYKNKTKSELLEIIDGLERKNQELLNKLSIFENKCFREKYSTRIFDALPDMLTVLDHNANVVELISSPATNHVEGTTRESLIHSNVKDIIPEEAYESVSENLEKVIRTGESSIANHQLIVDGERHYFENRIFPLDDKYLLCMCRDVSQEWKAKQMNELQQIEIERLNSLMDAVINNVPVYLFVKDPDNDFRYLYWNKTFADYSGIPVEKAIGHNDFEIFTRTEDMEMFHRLDLLVLEKGVIEYIEDYVTADGEVRTTSTVKKTVYSGNKKRYIIGISWDITDIKRTEKELIAARVKAEEADRLKSAFFANMSHEIRTPLNAVVGFSKVLIDTVDPAEKRLYTEVIEKNSELLLNLFNDILDLSAMEAGSLEFSIHPIRLADICFQLYQQLKNKTQNGVGLVLDQVDINVSVLGDWNRISQVIGNLLNNAIKFTAVGSILYGFKQKGKVVEFYVKDTGIGIPPERISKIFERFGKINNFTQGTGLGLTLSKMMIEKMGGEIWVESQEGEGTSFYFTLPAFIE